MRVIVADCSAEYSGRLNASLPLAKRVLLIKADSSLGLLQAAELDDRALHDS